MWSLIEIPSPVWPEKAKQGFSIFSSGSSEVEHASDMHNYGWHWLAKIMLAVWPEKARQDVSIFSSGGHSVQWGGMCEWRSLLLILVILHLNNRFFLKHIFCSTGHWQADDLIKSIYQICLSSIKRNINQSSVFTFFKFPCCPCTKVFWKDFCHYSCVSHEIYRKNEFSTVNSLINYTVENLAIIQYNFIVKKVFKTLWAVRVIDIVIKFRKQDLLESGSNSCFALGYNERKSCFLELITIYMTLLLYTL